MHMHMQSYGKNNTMVAMYLFNENRIFTLSRHDTSHPSNITIAWSLFDEIMACLLSSDKIYYKQWIFYFKCNRRASEFRY